MYVKQCMNGFRNCNVGKTRRELVESIFGVTSPERMPFLLSSAELERFSSLNCRISLVYPEIVRDR